MRYWPWPNRSTCRTSLKRGAHKKQLIQHNRQTILQSENVQRKTSGMSNRTLGNRTQWKLIELCCSIQSGNLYIQFTALQACQVYCLLAFGSFRLSHFNHVRLSVESFRQRVRAVPYILLLNQWLKERGIKCIGIFCVMAERTREDVTEQVLARRVGVSETTRKRNRLLPVYLRVRKNTLFSPRLVNWGKVRSTDPH